MAYSLLPLISEVAVPAGQPGCQPPPRSAACPLLCFPPTGHLKCNHGVWLTAANVLALGTVSLLPLVSGAVEEALLRWLRAAELTCDRAALLVAQVRAATPPV